SRARGRSAGRCAALILGRRSAQRFDPAHVMSAAAFARLLDVLRADTAARVSLLLFVHRVEGLAPGLYLLPRGPWGGRLTEGLAMAADRQAGRLPAGLLQLQTMEPVALRRAARSLHCHQDIAANACLAFGMLAPFAPLVEAEPAAYRDLLREAGLLGQRLYLEAEAMGLRGTGIGCFFDDPVHEAAGVDAACFQALYHFTIGLPVDDVRIETTPAYPFLAEEPAA
ncbi:nitroreductase family protein, partial [Zoogloea sp.]|uniref:nitroreductase family protein n=1 Tax=Zoogloea sp. TaxID=49181 RepID=UPI0014163A98